MLEDVGAIADAARRLPMLEHEVLVRVDAMQARLDGLREDLAPLGELAQKIPGVG